MHTIKITPNLLFEYQCTSGKFIRLQIENNRFGNKNLIESNRNFFARIGMVYRAAGLPQLGRRWQTSLTGHRSKSAGAGAAAGGQRHAL